MVEPSSHPPVLQSMLITQIPSGPVRVESNTPNRDFEFWLSQGMHQQDYSTNFNIISTPSTSNDNMFQPEEHLPALMPGTINTSADQTFSYINEVHNPIDEGSTIPSQPGLDIVWSNWPPNLPRLELLRHL